MQPPKRKTYKICSVCSTNVLKLYNKPTGSISSIKLNNGRQSKCCRSCRERLLQQSKEMINESDDEEMDSDEGGEEIQFKSGSELVENQSTSQINSSQNFPQTTFPPFNWSQPNLQNIVYNGILPTFQPFPSVVADKIFPVHLFSKFRMIDFTNNNDSDLSNCGPMLAMDSNLRKELDINCHLARTIQAADSPSFLIYDSKFTIMDKVAAYSFLTSAGCSISKDVHEWLREKLYEQFKLSIQVEKIKTDFQKHAKNRNCQTYGASNSSPEISNESSEFSPRITKKSTKKPVIEIKQSAGLQCNECTSTNITTTSTKRSTTPLEDLEPRSRNQKGERLSKLLNEILVTNGENLDSYMDWYLERNEAELFEKITNYAKSGPSYLTKMYHHLSTIGVSELEENLSPLGAVYFTDKHLISDCHFYEFYSYHHLNGITCTADELKNKRHELNEEIIKKLNINFTDNSIHVDTKSVLQMMIDLIKAVTGEVPDELELKSFWDGRPGNDVIHALVALNTQLAAQCRNNAFVTDMYHGKETSIDISNYFKKTFTNLNDLVKTGFMYDLGNGKTKKVKIKVFVCPDMSGLWKMMGETFVCPFCNATHKNRHKCLREKSLFTEKSLKHTDYDTLLNFMVIDVLHAKLRIVESLLKLVLGPLKKDAVEDVCKEFQRYPYFSQFKFREEAKKQTSSNKQLEEKLEIELPYINGNQADIILKNFENIFFNCLSKEEFTEQHVKLFTLIRTVIYNYMEAPTQVLERTYSTENKQHLKTLLKEIADEFHDSFSNFEFGYYVHIILEHLPQLLDKFGSLAKYMNQGCEAVHALGRLISSRKSNHLASNNRPSFSECILLPWRLAFMAVEHKKPWVGLLRQDRNLSEKYIKVIDNFQQESMEMLKKTESESSQVVLDKCVEKRNQFVPLLNPKKEATKNIDMWEKTSRIQKPNKMKARRMKRNKLVDTRTQSNELSCLSCRNAHKSCDHKKPKCSYCDKRGLDCIIPPPKVKHKKGVDSNASSQPEACSSSINLTQEEDANMADDEDDDPFLD